MSLSTQLSRGTLALPLLLLFAALAIASNEEVASAPMLDAPASAMATSLEPALACSLPRPGLRLAHAPGDLLPLRAECGA